MVRGLVLSDDATQSLSDLFDEQSKNFIKDDTIKVRFSESCFKADSGTILFVEQYHLPTIYRRALDDSSSIPRFTMSKTDAVHIRSIFAIDTNEQTGESILFQSSGATKILDTNRTLFYRDDSFHKLNEPGFIIDSQLAAIFKDGRLYFRSYSVVNRFLDLMGYLHAATNPQIRDFLNSPLFVCDDIDAVLDCSDDWMRRRFTSIQTLGTLKNLNAKTAAKKAKKYKIDLSLADKNGKKAFIVPKDKKEIKQLLRFLNEEYYTGELTGNQYLTNSHTQVANVEQ